MTMTEQARGGVMTCPSCGEGRLDPIGSDENGMVACDHCGRRAYAGYVAEAAYLTDLREQQDRRLDWLVAQVRTGVGAPDAERATRAYAWAPPTRGVPPVAPAPASSAPVLLVLGTGLLVVAALVFVAVVWNQIGAAGQAIALSSFAAGTAALAVRLRDRLGATAEALAVSAMAVLTIELLAAPHLGLLPFRVPNWGGWYQPSAFAVVAVAGLVGGATYRIRAWNVLGWLAIVPATGLLALAVVRHADHSNPAHASGYGALVAISVGLALVRIEAVLPRRERAIPWGQWPLVSGSVLLASAAGAAPWAVAANGARISWLVAGVTTSFALALLQASATTTGRRWGAGLGLVVGLTAALALLPGNADSLSLATSAAALGAAVLAAGVVTRRVEIGHVAAGALWVSWLGGRLIQHVDHATPTLATQTVSLAAVAAAVLLVDAVLNHRAVLAWVAAGSGILAAATAAGHSDVHLLEGFTLPAAGLLLIAGVAWRRERPSSSLEWCGPATAVALLPSAFATWMSPWNAIDFGDPTPESREQIVRLVAVVVAAGLVAIVGSRLRWGGLLLPASVALGITATAQIWATAHVLPKWVVLASVGAALVAAGARLEWLRDQRTRLDDWADRLA
jgi:hypothetical protein